MSNFGISPSAAGAICEPRMPTHTESRIVRFMGHPRTARLNVTGLGVDHLDPLSALTKIKNVRFGSKAGMAAQPTRLLRQKTQLKRRQTDHHVQCDRALK